MIDEPAKVRFLRLLWQLTGRRPRIDRLLSGFLRYRKYLPESDPQDLIPRFFETEIKIRQCPIGTWSTPLVDVFILLKAAIGFRSSRILELGSYRGDTAKLLAENTGPDTSICAVDVDEQHGASYRDSEIAKRIQRKTGRICAKLFETHEKFDFIFVDADHDFNSVMEHSQLAFKLLDSQGIILWHDYALETYFHGLCGVPEALNQLAKYRPIRAIRGTWLALYSNVSGWETGRSLSNPDQPAGASVWREQQLRG